MSANILLDWANLAKNRSRRNERGPYRIRNQRSHQPYYSSTFAHRSWNRFNWTTKRIRPLRSVQLKLKANANHSHRPNINPVPREEGTNRKRRRLTTIPQSNSGKNQPNDSKMKKIAIFGATSAVAQKISLIHTQAGDSLVLIGRNQSAINVIAADLNLRGPRKCHTIAAELTDSDDHARLISQIFDEAGEIDCVYIAYGTLPDQSGCQANYTKARHAFEVNCLSQISLLTNLAEKMKPQRHGTIAVITSVAGDRGRKSNYIYGAAKGMLSIYLQGLRNALFEHNVHVLDVRPGFIDTPMTAHIEKKGLLWASPQKVATDIVNAASRKKDVIYTPWFWSLIMLIIRSIPEFKFKKMSL